MIPIQPHGLFSVWSPDEVAECLEGVTPDLYQALWALVPLYEGQTHSEVLDDFNRRCVAKYWTKLSLAHRILLNQLAEKSRIP